MLEVPIHYYIPRIQYLIPATILRNVVIVGTLPNVDKVILWSALSEPG